MAPIDCRECGRRISSEVVVCPHCGCSRPGERRSEAGTGARAEAGERAARLSARELDRRRTVYYLLYFTGIPVAIAARFVEAPGLALLLGVVGAAWLVVFLWVFLKTARLAGLSAAALVPIALLLMVPLVGIITLMVVDFHIADTVERGLRRAVKPRVSRLSYWSLIMAWLPIVGLPMAAVALWQISASRGMLTGRGLAIAGVVVNALLAAGVAALVVAAVLAPSSP